MPKPSVGAAFDAGSEHFLRWSPLLWDPLGGTLVAAVDPRPGERVLDACCGAGASALPAAEAVGPTGRVDAVDLAGALVEHGRSLATAAGHGHLRFAQADVTSWTGDGEPYDVLQCAYGVFFLPDLDPDVAGLLRRLRPGGRFAALVWRRGGMDRIPAILLDLVREERPDLQLGDDVSQRVNTPELFTGWLENLGLERVRVEVVPFSVPLDSDRAWSLVVGTVLRTVLDGLPAGTVERIRLRYLERLAAEGMTTLDATSLLGIGVRR